MDTNNGVLMNPSKIYNKEYFQSKKVLNGKYYDYNEFNSSIEKHYWHFALKKALQHKSSGKALDIGCASAHLTAALPKSFEKYGCDISDYAIKTAKRLHPEIKVKKADISKKKPFKEKFDLILAFDVLEHVLDLRTTLKNIHGMLEEDGVFVAGVPVSSNAHFLLSGLGISFLNADSHITQTKTKTWKEIIFPEFFELIESTPITLNSQYLYPFELNHLFILKKRNNTLMP